MKKTLFVLAALLFVGSYSFAQNKPASPKKIVSADGISVTYSAPSKKGRAIFGGLVPFDKVWRTGANNATEITFDSDVKFGGVAVAAGTYSLFTIPTSGEEWTVILNPTLKQWGAYKYNKIKDADLEHTTASVSELTEEVEIFDIAIVDGNVVISWDKTAATIVVE